jgi:PAS domain S-box-containing protein
MPEARDQAMDVLAGRPSEAGATGGAAHAQTHTLQSVLESVSDGVVVTDDQGHFLHFNRAAEDILGIGAADVPPEVWTDTYGLFLPDRVTPYPPEDLPLARAIRGESVQEAEIFVRNPRLPQGAVISVNATPWKDGDGAVLGGIAVFRDITPHKQADEAIQRLSNAVEQTADSVYITDRNGVIEYVNPGFEQTTGYSSDEAVGQTPRLLKSGRHDAEHYRAMWGTLLSGEVFRGTLVNRRKNGQIYYVEMTVTPIKDSSGAVAKFVAVGKDMTDRRARQEQELQLSVAHSVQRELFPRRAPELPGFDIAGVAHPATEMCGDYFDYVAMPGDCLGIVVGDVRGHGIGPAIVMAETRAYLRAYMRTHSDVTEAVHALNEALVADLEDGNFVTLLLADLNPRDRRLTFANAGHVPGYILRPSGEVKAVLGSTGTPLGIVPDCGVESSPSVQLDPGDILVFLTDGITECEAPDRSQFGVERALDLVRAHRDKPAARILEALLSGVHAFAQGSPQHDDVTAVICKVEGAA